MTAPVHEPMRDRVVAASDAWVWWPDNAEVLATEEFTLVGFPEWFATRLSLLRFAPVRPATEVMAEVLGRAGGTGLPELVWWVRLDTPALVEQALQHLGGVLHETLDVLALDLTDGLPDLAIPGPSDVTMRWVDDVAVMRDSRAVVAEVFGDPMPPAARMELETLQTRADHANGHGGALVAYDADRVVGTAGLSVVDGVARLWSGAVLPGARGRGVYRALLAERLRYAVEHGATLALVKGRVESSGPILRRAGFAAFGQERSYVVAL